MNNENDKQFIEQLVVTVLMSSVGLTILNSFKNGFNTNWIGAVSISVSIGLILFNKFHDSFSLNKRSLFSVILTVLIFLIITFFAVKLIDLINNTFIHHSFIKILSTLSSMYRPTIPNFVNFCNEYVFPLVSGFVFLIWCFCGNLVSILLLTLLFYYISILCLFVIRKYLID